QARGAAPGSSAHAPSGERTSGTHVAQTTPPRAPSTASSARATVTQSAQLPPAPPGMVTALTRALGDSVTNSGLFYESHLAQMSFGKRSPEQLAREPQALLGRGLSQEP